MEEFRCTLSFLKGVNEIKECKVYLYANGPKPPHGKGLPQCGRYPWAVSCILHVWFLGRHPRGSCAGPDPALGAAAAFPRMVPSMLFTLSGFLLAVNKCV